MTELWLDPIHPDLRAQAVEAFTKRDARGFLRFASNADGIDLVSVNTAQLLKAGIYEEALVAAFINPSTNHVHVPVSQLQIMFKHANRERLVALGDPLPDKEELILFRGISGRGPNRRVRAFSWTSDLEKARWFANRFSMYGEPAVYQATAKRDEIYFRTDARSESEYVWLPPPKRRISRI